MWPVKKSTCILYELPYSYLCRITHDTGVLPREATKGHPGSTARKNNNKRKMEREKEGLPSLALPYTIPITHIRGVGHTFRKSDEMLKAYSSTLEPNRGQDLLD